MIKTAIISLAFGSVVQFSHPNIEMTKHNGYKDAVFYKTVTFIDAQKHSHIIEQGDGYTSFTGNTAFDVGASPDGKYFAYCAHWISNRHEGDFFYIISAHDGQKIDFIDNNGGAYMHTDGGQWCPKEGHVWCSDNESNDWKTAVPKNGFDGKIAD